ncbi:MULTISPECIES: antibiotic biosynthesis monooxygenase [Halobacillus]|uniref:antibiotic biosynthesis monooxygenase n=1 Tax=Halobacillus TaxID=45667 RepID=UPI00136E43BB|nr:MULTISPECIES: antibiotic biosynthesis monooxygenase [Halobacillus]MCA1022465.1 antibiotic biosynthesis monooxygenase [Halobacillus litoralis]MYL30505.1 antibiotic biosynthesis monooxygenase [Halobacillus halophilus]MYL38873.1 antibiotic biosynthesis monooxygenase [Halobacillus litoralis]
MYIESKYITVKEGYAEELASRFDQPLPIEDMPGFQGLSIAVEKARKGEQMVIITTKFLSKDDYKAWKKSDAHVQGHKSKQKPDFVLNTSLGLYEEILSR